MDQDQDQFHHSPIQDHHLEITEDLPYSPQTMMNPEEENSWELVSQLCPDQTSTDQLFWASWQELAAQLSIIGILALGRSLDLEGLDLSMRLLDQKFVNVQDCSVIQKTVQSFMNATGTNGLRNSPSTSSPVLWPWLSDSTMRVSQPVIGLSSAQTVRAEITTKLLSFQ